MKTMLTKRKHKAVLFLLIIHKHERTFTIKKVIKLDDITVTELDLFEPVIKPDSTTANRKVEHLCRKTNKKDDKTDVALAR